jgi:hypothetical protein
MKNQSGVLTKNTANLTNHKVLDGSKNSGPEINTAEIS